MIRSKLETLRVETVQLVLERLMLLDVSFAVLHGLENYPVSIGRDVDLFVEPEDAKSALKEIFHILREKDWETGVQKMSIGIDQIFAYRKDENSVPVVWLEIDLIHHHPFCWQGQELLAEGVSRDDLVTENGFPTYPYGWVAKNLLLQLVAGKKAKFLKNYQEFFSKPDFQSRALMSANRHGLYRTINDLLEQADEVRDFEKLRSQFRRKLRLSLLTPKRGLRLLQTIGPWFLRTYKLYFPREGCVPRVCIFGKNKENLARSADGLKRTLEETYPFPKVILADGAKLCKPKTEIGRWISFLRKGWARELQYSSTLHMKIEMWSEENKDDIGSTLTKGDISLDSSCCRDEASKKIANALMKNLKSMAL